VPGFEAPLHGPLDGSVVLALALGLDLLLGDPAGWPHPVRAIGALLAAGERAARRLGTGRAFLRGAGVVLALAVPALTWLAARGLLAVAARVHPGLGIAVAVYLAYTCISLKGLAAAAGAVGRRLGAGDLEGARAAVAHIVGRDTGSLDAPGVAAAAVESAAENASDGVVAPLLYLALGGPALGLAYKAVNTADSMLGYRNARYADLGWAAARLDDLANWVPARLTALLLAAAAGLLGLSARGAWRTARADARHHASPNAGWPEAAVAGALGVTLGGPAVYGGEPHPRAVLGAGGAAPAAADVARAVRLLWLAGLLAGALAVAGAGVLP
jgi:adenosylcobinamide-phosphate synthase